MTNTERAERIKIGNQMRGVSRDWGGPILSDETIFNAPIERLRAIKTSLDASGRMMGEPQILDEADYWSDESAESYIR